MNLFWKAILTTAVLVTTSGFAAAGGGGGDSFEACTPDEAVCANESGSQDGFGDCDNIEDGYYFQDRTYWVDVDDGTHTTTVGLSNWCYGWESWGFSYSEKHLTASASRTENGGWGGTGVTVDWYSYATGGGGEVDGKGGQEGDCGVQVYVSDSDLPYYYQYATACPLGMEPPMIVPSLLA